MICTIVHLCPFPGLVFTSLLQMAYSVNEVTEVRGEFWMQEPLLAKIDNLATHVEKAIKEFKEVSGKPPHEIVVLRGGVSEGEFPKVRSHFLQSNLIVV